MKCWECKKQIDYDAILVYRPAKNNREISQFRDICEECYKIIEPNAIIINKKKEGCEYGYYQR